MAASAFNFSTFGAFQHHNPQPIQRSRGSSVSSQRSVSSVNSVSSWRSVSPRRSISPSWRSVSPRRSISPSRAPLSEKNVAIGSIVFLPRSETCITCAKPDCKKDIDMGAFDHPAIILHMWKPKDGELMTLACTMSGNSKPCPQDNVRTLPIARQPKGKIQDSYEAYQPEEVLYLEKTGTLTKQSYLLVKHIYPIPLSKLAPFGGEFENRLSEESYTGLMKIMNLEAAPWIQSAELEAGKQDPSTLSTTLKAGLAKPTRRMIATPMAAFIKKAQTIITTTEITVEHTPVETPAPKAGKKQKKFMATGHDLLTNMASQFA